MEDQAGSSINELPTNMKINIFKGKQQNPDTQQSNIHNVKYPIT